MVNDGDVPDLRRAQIMQMLLESCKEGKPNRGVHKEAAVRFGICIRTVGRIWKTAMEQKNQGEVINVSSIRSKRIRKRKHVINYPRIEAVAVNKRKSLESLSSQLGISKTTLHRWAKGHLLRPHSSSLKPLLTAQNMLRRLSFSLQSLEYDRQNHILKFKAMENTVHIDEKWFYITTKSCRYYLTPLEADPQRVTQSKNFIPKVMFMCVVSRPVYDANGQILFDGKICIWPFIEEYTAQRDSIRRKRGTKEMRPIQSITRDVIKKLIIQQVVPAIKAKWPAFLSKTIMIQQDNARPHMQNNDADFQTLANEDGFHIKFVQQPPNSPDCNTLDLGFFCAIQSLQQRHKCKNADELILAVKNSFEELDPMTLNKVFLSLQCVLKEILKVKGSNDYKHVHMSKNALLRQGNLPTNLEIEDCLVRECIDHLIREECTDGIEALMEDMGITPPQNGGGLLDLNI